MPLKTKEIDAFSIDFRSPAHAGVTLNNRTTSEIYSMTDNDKGSIIYDTDLNLPVVNVGTGLGIDMQPLALTSHTSNLNYLANPSFYLWQRGTNFSNAADAIYTADQWINLSDGNGVVTVTQLNSSLNKSQHSYRMLVSNVNKKFGLFQPLSNEITKHFSPTSSFSTSQVASFSFYAHTISTNMISNIGACIVGWTGSPDSITRDIVFTWNAQGTAPTLSTNWIYIGTPQFFSLAPDEINYFKIENVTVPGTGAIKNIGVFIWSDETTTSLNDILDIGSVKLELSPFSTSFNANPVSVDYIECTNFYQIVGSGSVGQFLTSSNVFLSEKFFRPMYKVPSISLLTASPEITSVGGGSAIDVLGSSSSIVPGSEVISNDRYHLELTGFTSTAGNLALGKQGIFALDATL